MFSPSSSPPLPNLSINVVWGSFAADAEAKCYFAAPVPEACVLRAARGKGTGIRVIPALFLALLFFSRALLLRNSWLALSLLAPWYQCSMHVPAVSLLSPLPLNSTGIGKYISVPLQGEHFLFLFFFFSLP